MAALLGTTGVVAVGSMAGATGASAQSTSVDQLLTNAARTESAAYLQYNAYATAAQKKGRAMCQRVAHRRKG
ncbi:MAG TPA: hypothetical protein VE570_13685 [Thermoleophilaceae bacterium]|nr:hypothetical protein [Thermoleophilaceae bacterium]